MKTIVQQQQARVTHSAHIRPWHVRHVVHALLALGLFVCPTALVCGQDTDYLKQRSQANPENGESMCGPTAATNCLTRLFAADPGSPLATYAPERILQHFSRAMGTHPELGTPTPMLTSGLRKLLQAYGYRRMKMGVFSPKFVRQDLSLSDLRKKLNQPDVCIMIGLSLNREVRPGKWDQVMGHWTSLKSISPDLRRVTLVEPHHGWEIETLVQKTPPSLAKAYPSSTAILNGLPYKGHYTLIEWIVVIEPGRRTHRPVAENRLPVQAPSKVEGYARLFQHRPLDAPVYP